MNDLLGPGLASWTNYFAMYGAPAYNYVLDKYFFFMGGHVGGIDNGMYSIDPVALAAAMERPPTPRIIPPFDYPDNPRSDGSGTYVFTGNVTQYSDPAGRYGHAGEIIPPAGQVYGNAVHMESENDANLIWIYIGVVPGSGNWSNNIFLYHIDTKLWELMAQDPFMTREACTSTYHRSGKRVLIYDRTGIAEWVYGRAPGTRFKYLNSGREALIGRPDLGSMLVDEARNRVLFAGCWDNSGSCSLVSFNLTTYVRTIHTTFPNYRWIAPCFERDTGGGRDRYLLYQDGSTLSWINPDTFQITTEETTLVSGGEPILSNYSHENGVGGKGRWSRNLQCLSFIRTI